MLDGLVIFGFIMVIAGIPFILSVFNVVHLCIALKHRIVKNKFIKRVNFKIVDIITFFLGFVDLVLYTGYCNITDKDYKVVLSNGQVHTPINSTSLMTIIVLTIIGIIGYVILTYLPVKKMPPLILSIGIAFLYIGNIINILWIIQVCKGPSNSNAYGYEGFILSLVSINLFIITMATLLDCMNEWRQRENDTEITNSKFIKLRKFFNKSWSLPVVGLILLLPVLGIIIMILTLFGQSPNAIITAWTHTSQWNLSKFVSPQNVQTNEHYLCTVAAGGHKKVVKPQRLGVRHGHYVVVNRQLCIANAFEQVIEEKTPHFHKIVRSFYDKYGYPVARLIHSKYIADCVYFLMKPLEWVFLIVLYLVDVHPEDRIAMQYITKLPEDKIVK